MCISNIKRIFFVGDLLRNHSNAPYFADRSLGWEYFIFKEQIHTATGIMPNVAFASENSIFDINIFYKLCNYEVNFKNCLKIVSGSWTKESLEYFYECFKDSLIITQVGVTLKLIMDELNIPYIDIYISAIKFMEDIIFAFRTNVDSIRIKLLDYVIPEKHIQIEANRVRVFYFAHKYINTELNIKKNSLLLCGQTDVDLSLVKNGKIINFLDYKDKINDIFHKYDNIYYKIHPTASLDNQNWQFICSFQNIKITNNNFYQLMCHDNIKAVAALSSGTLKAAPYFDKDIHIISHSFINYYNNEYPINRDDFILTKDEYYSPTFWSDILSPIFHTNKTKYFNFRNRKNFLRESLQQF